MEPVLDAVGAPPDAAAGAYTLDDFAAFPPKTQKRVELLAARGIALTDDVLPPVGNGDNPLQGDNTHEFGNPGDLSSDIKLAFLDGDGYVDLVVAAGRDHLRLEVGKLDGVGRRVRADAALPRGEQAHL